MGRSEKQIHNFIQKKKLKGKDQLGGLRNEYERIRTRKHEMDLPGLDLERMGGSCELGNETSGSIKAGRFLYKLSNCKILMKDCVP
jgi:hypothetical protein